jgi:hypothetical protein
MLAYGIVSSIQNLSIYNTNKLNLNIIYQQDLGLELCNICCFNRTCHKLGLLHMTRYLLDQKFIGTKLEHL